MVAILLVVVLLGPFAYFFAPGFVNSKSLAASVTDKSGGTSSLYPPSCKRIDHVADTWNCSVPEPGGSGGSGAYRVTTRNWGCWDAERTGAKFGDGIRWPDHVSGCVKLGDDFRLFEGL